MALPKIFRLKKDGRLIRSIFDGDTINTPSMLVVEDYLRALAWARSAGGIDALINKAETSAGLIWDFCAARHGSAHLPVIRRHDRQLLSVSFSMILPLPVMPPLPVMW